MTRPLAARSATLALSLGFLAVLSASAGTAAARRSPTPSFTGLGDLPGGERASYAFGISRSGDVIAGESFSAISQVHGEGVRWSRIASGAWQTAGIGLPGLDALNSPAAGTSANGKWIVGRASFGPPSSPAIDTDAYRWNPSTGFQRLGLFPGYVISAALGADASGNVIVGYGGPDTGYSNIRALLWRQRGLGFDVESLEPTYVSQAIRIDASGRFASGWGNSPAAQAAEGSAGREAACWILEGKHRGERRWLGALPSTPFHSEAYGLTRRGPDLLLVGFSGTFPDAILPVLWTLGEDGSPSLRELPLAPGFTGAAAYAISDRGQRIAGTVFRTVGGDLQFDGCVWELDTATNTYSVFSLTDLLASLGVVDPQAWTLWGTADLSADGTVLCGSGTDPEGFDEAWVAELP